LSRKSRYSFVGSITVHANARTQASSYKYRDIGAAKKAASTISYQCTAKGVAKQPQPIDMHMPCKAACS